MMKVMLDESDFMVLLGNRQDEVELAEGELGLEMSFATMYLNLQKELEEKDRKILEMSTALSGVNVGREARLEFMLGQLRREVFRLNNDLRVVKGKLNKERRKRKKLNAFVFSPDLDRGEYGAILLRELFEGDQ